MARGSIIQRGDKTWRIAVELEPDPLTGKRRQQWHTFHGGKRAAEEERTRLQAEADKGKLVADPKMTVADYFEKWLSDYASTKGPKTCSTYRCLVKNYVVPHLGAVQLGKLTPSHLVKLFSLLRETSRKDTGEKLSPATLNAVFRMVRTAMNVAVKRELIGRNPIKGVDAPSVPRKEMKTFTVEQAKAFLDASVDEGLKWQGFFTLLLTTGARPGELKAIRWIDINLDTKMMSIQQNGQRVPGVGRVIGQPKTGGSRRQVALSTDVVSLLKKHRIEQNEERLQSGPLWKDNGLVFCSEVGTMLEDKAVRRAFYRICDRASVPRIRPYDLRHSSASLLLAAGIHPKVVAERLGHANVNLTLNLYSHVLPGLQQDAADTLEALLRNGDN